MDWAYLKNIKDGEKNNREETNHSKLGRPSALRRISWPRLGYGKNKDSEL